MFTDPANAGLRDGGPQSPIPAAPRGRRRFGEACLAKSPAGARPGLDQSFLRPGANGSIDCQILLLPGFEMNELAALADSFAAVNRLRREARFAWLLASLDGKPVKSAGGISIAVGEAAIASEPTHLFILSAYGSAAASSPALNAWLCRRSAAPASCWPRRDCCRGGSASCIGRWRIPCWRVRSGSRSRTACSPSTSGSPPVPGATPRWISCCG
jgi:hypothetical protein